MKYSKLIAIIIVFFILCNYISVAQNNQATNDTINKYDSLGKKDGYWIEYLSKSFRIVKNTKRAKYCWYIRYQHGTRFESPLIPYIYRTTIKKNDSLLNNNGITMLDGVYIVYIKKEQQLNTKFVFRKGLLLNEINYYTDGSIAVLINFEEKYKEKILSCSFKQFNEKGKLVEDVFSILENGKWKYIKK